MSGKIVRLVLEYPWQDLGGVRASTLRAVAVALADSADQSGQAARPGLRALARRAGIHTETAGRALQALCAAGLVHLTRPTDGRHPAQYALEVRALDPRTSSDEIRALARGSEPRAARGYESAQDVLTSTSTFTREESTVGLAGLAAARAALSSSSPSEPMALKASDLTRQRSKRRFVRYQGADPPVIVDPGATQAQAG